MTMRPTWEEYALRLADVAAMRSEDPFMQVGCCILRKDKSVLSCSYNGPPAGITVDMSDRDARRPFMIHAELNALRYAMPDEGMLVATTHCPCPDCVRQIAAYRIERVIFRHLHSTSEAAMALAEKFRIHMRQWQ